MATPAPGPWACLCSCDPPVRRGGAWAAGASAESDETDEDESVDVPEAGPPRGGPRRAPAGQKRLKAEALAEAPDLGPVGSGGWHAEEDLTDDMRLVAKQAKDLYVMQQKVALTEFNLRFLTSVTLRSYVNPVATQHLVNALTLRAQNEDALTLRQPVYLGCSARVIGWDATGASVFASEPCTMRRSMQYVMHQMHYVGWSALDLNKPGVDGFTVIMDYGGGFNPMHFLNPKPVIELAHLVESQWRRRLNKALLVDMPASFRVILNIFLRFVNPATRDKIRMVPSSGEAISELERMGCDAETIENARRYMHERRQPGRKHTWHPLVDFSFFRDYLADLHLSEDTEEITEEIHMRLREAVQAFRLSRWGPPTGRGTAAAPPADDYDFCGSESSFDAASTAVPLAAASPKSPLPPPVRSTSSFGVPLAAEAAVSGAEALLCCLPASWAWRMATRAAAPNGLVARCFMAVHSLCGAGPLPEGLAVKVAPAAARAAAQGRPKGH